MERKPPRLRVGAFISCEYAYKPGSVLIVIYLRVPSPVRSSHLGSSRAGLCSHTGVAPDRVYSDGRFHTPSGELLPRLSTLTSSTQSRRAVYLCCTFPEVAFGGRYPLSLPCGARTFLMDGLSPCPRDYPAYSLGQFYPNGGGKSTKIYRTRGISSILSGTVPSSNWFTARISSSSVRYCFAASHRVSPGARRRMTRDGRRAFSCSGRHCTALTVDSV